MTKIAIIDAKRTAIGAFLGSLEDAKATTLASYVVKALLEKIQKNIGVKENVLKEKIFPEELYMGCVLQANQGQAPARQVIQESNLPWSIPATTINKVCGSSLQAIHFALNALRLGERHFVLAGGMESMSNAPYMLEKARKGFKFSHQTLLDHMLRDGLENPFDSCGNKFLSMGFLAEKTAEHFALSREEQEDYVTCSYQHALKAPFYEEIIPILQKNGELMTQDEPLLRVRPEKFKKLKPAFQKEGTITAATASPLADGAAVIALASESWVDSHDTTPLGWILGVSCFSGPPEHFTTAPIKAIESLCHKLDWPLESIDTFEINEAFAIVPLLAIKALNIPPQKVNPSGGACVLGHPIGATGARLVVTLIHHMDRNNLRRGIACACIGGGEAIAIAIERS